MTAKSRAALTEGPLGRTLFVFTLPILASNVLQSLNGSVNAVWVGRFLGEDALAATTNGNLVMFLLMAFVFGFGMAATVHVSAVIPNFRITEYFVNFEQICRDIAIQGLAVKEGWIDLPMRANTNGEITAGLIPSRTSLNPKVASGASSTSSAQATSPEPPPSA